MCAKINIDFYSNCYPKEATVFQIYLEGAQEECDSEPFVAPIVEKIGGELVAEDSYEFEGKEYREVHDSLLKLGWRYQGPCEPEALDTCKE